MLRVLLAIWAAKATAAALRLLGRQGTHVPGRVARRLHPDIIAAIRKPDRVVAVTGTNGKTTVSNLLAEALALQGKRVASNRNGSNIPAGVAATLIAAVDWRGRPRADIAVLEVDERSALLILPGLDPELLVCMNLTRDSVKRNAHPAYIAWILSKALPERTRLVLNADDLLAASIGGAVNDRVLFAIDRQPGDGDRASGAAVDVAICPECDQLLEWDYWRFNHIGRVRCPSCDFSSPEAGYRVGSIDRGAATVVIDFAGEQRQARLVNDNIVNVYNQLAVAATLDLLGVGRDRIVAAFDSIRPPTTRFDAERIGAVTLARLLTKGLVGVACSRAFEYLMTFAGRKAIVMNIDEVTERVTEVENTCWIYDADYEFLDDATLEQIVVGGVRRHDHALRLAIAGVDPSRIVTVESELAAADRVELDGVDAVFNLHSVHNALSTGGPVQARLRERLAAGTGADS